MGVLRNMMVRRSVNEYLCISLILVVLLCGFFWKVVFLGHVFTAADMLFVLDPWRPYAPEGFVKPANDLHCDEVLAFYPWRMFTVEMMHKGQIPLWNPYVMHGAPHFANYQTTVLDPLSAIFYFVPIKPALGLTAIVKLFLCGVFAYAFAKTLGLGRGAATFCAVTYAFCGYNVGWLKWPLTSAMVWLPLILLCIEKLLGARRLGWMLLLGVVVGMLFLSGHPESIFTILIGVSTYTLSRAVQCAWRSRAVRRGFNLALCVGVAILVGGGIAAVQLVPFAEFAVNSWTVVERAEIEVALTHCVFPMLAQFFVPNFYGNSEHDNYWGFRNSNIDASIYLGVSTLILAAVAIVLLRKASGDIRRPAIALLIGALACMGFAFRIFPFSLSEKLPVFNQLRYEYFVAFYCISAPVLGAVGLQLFMQAEQKERRNGLLAGLLLLILAFCICLVFARVFRGMIQIQHLERYLLVQMVKFVSWGVATVVLLTLFYKRRLSASVLTAGLVCVTVADLFSFLINYNPTLESKYVFPDTKLFQQLRDDKSLYRVWCHVSPVPNSALMVYGIGDEWGYDGIYYYRSVAFPLGLKKLYWQKFAGLLNIKYYLQGPIPGGEIDYTDTSMFRFVDTLDNVSLFEYVNMLPRALVVHRATVAKSEDELFDVLRSDAFDPASAVALEKEVPAELMAALEQAPVTDGSTATIREYEPNSVTIDADMENAGFLILADTYYPGWKVFVDGEEKELYAADFIARSVFVPEGEHVVRFVYAPLSFKVGAGLSVLTLAFLGVAALVDRSRRKRVSGIGQTMRCEPSLSRRQDL